MAEEVATGKKDLKAFLIDTQEEIMDALLYIEAAKACLRDEIEEVYANQMWDEDDLNDRMDIIGRNGNTGEHYEDDDDYWKSNSSYPISKYP